LSSAGRDNDLMGVKEKEKKKGRGKGEERKERKREEFHIFLLPS
jgi:hypothetical protein